MKLGLLSAGVVAVIGLLGSTSLAGATTLTETATTGALQVTDFTDNLSLAGFNASLGTLTGVTFSLSANSTFNGTVTNSAAVAENFKISEDVNVSASSSAAALSALTTDLLAAQSYAGLASGASSAFGPFSPSNSVSGIATAAQISEFIGGNITAAITTLTGTTTLGGGGNIKNNINTLADATLTITYTYTPASSVPEPASMALLGLGLVGLGFIRKNTFSKSA